MTLPPIQLEPAIYDACNPVHINGVILPADYPPTDRIQIARRYSREGTIRWAIVKNSSCLSKSEKAFVYEAMNSNRTEDFIEDTRFDSVEEALAFLTLWREEELARVLALGYQVWQPKTP